MDKEPSRPVSRRDLMKPTQLVSLAALAGIFAGVITLIGMGFFERRFDGQAERALVVAGIIAGATFIVTLIVIALLLLMINPVEISQSTDKPVLIPKQETDEPAAESDGNNVATDQKD